MIALKKIENDINDLLKQNILLKQKLALLTQYENLKRENALISKKINEALERYV